jgi:hypothetical protein
MTANRKTNRTNRAEPSDDLQITKITRRAAGGGTWVCGTIAGYRFDALVFPEHAEVADYELGGATASERAMASAILPSSPCTARFILAMRIVSGFFSWP